MVCQVKDELMRGAGIATTFARSCNFGSSSWIRIIICLLTMNLRVRLANGKINIKLMNYPKEE